MPHPTKYLAGYGLHEGLQLVGWELDHIDIQHVTVVTYHKYRYPTKMYWRRVSGTKPASELAKAVKKYLTDRRINSEYGNPYQCAVGTIDVYGSGSSNNKVTLGFEGVCDRVYSKQ